MAKTRCATTPVRLEQELNSLHAQREACAAYVASQKHEGWVLLDDQHDDGGFSGGLLERPASQQPLADIRSGKIDQIINILDGATASFVSVT
ncbi:MAG: recombinase family protein [Pseudomonadota bacterium]